MKTITLIFGQRIRDIRVSKNISQERLAELCKLHPTYIGQIERGEKSPTLESIFKISHGLDISIERLFQNLYEYPAMDKTDYALKIYNDFLELPEEKQKKLYNIISAIINL